MTVTPWQILEYMFCLLQLKNSDTSCFKTVKKKAIPKDQYKDLNFSIVPSHSKVC